MRIVPLATWMNDAAATGSNARSDLVPRLRRIISHFRQVDIVIGPPVGDLGNGFVDRSPGFQACSFRIRRVGWFGERGEKFAWAKERNCQHYKERWAGE